MKYQIFFLPYYYLWMIDCTHLTNNNSEVFITYAGHSEVERPMPVSKSDTKNRQEEKPVDTVRETDKDDHDTTEGVVFIPNDKPVFRNEDLFYDGVKVKDLIETRRISDVVRDKKIVITETEAPKDILFISGKNNENVEKPVEFAKKPMHRDSAVVKVAKSKSKRLNCTNLECNNTVNSVCGGKEENKHWKYRLFLNECFFRKVNCGFQHAVNRYDLVSMDNCKNIGAHFLSRPYVFKPIPLPPQQKASETKNNRRTFSSRRSLNMGVDGSFCAHPCPVSCTEDYDPQCAVSSSGQIKMFMNHCKLDYNSCLYKVVWHRRPLSECVGGRKADMTQNRGFIGWMQRVGIVDRKGRLVLS